MSCVSKVAAAFKRSISGTILVASIAMFVAIEVPAMASGQIELMPRPANLIVSGEPYLTPLGLTRFCFANRAQCKVSNPIFRPRRMSAAKAALNDLDEVNRTVNRAIRPKPDEPGLLNDIWSIAPPAGDCDDYAVTKRAELLKRGWSTRSLLLAKAVAPSGEDHLVLVARTRLGDFVLDNLVTAVLPAAQTSLRWVALQSAGNPQIWHRVSVPRETGA